jgi:hypothetical protein
MLLFGHTNPSIIDRKQEKKPIDSTNAYNGSIFKRMENFEIIKEKFGEYPRVNKTVLPNEFKDFTINSIASTYKTNGKNK